MVSFITYYFASGARIGLLVCTTLNLIGQLLLAIGALKIEIILMLLGRFIYGIGGSGQFIAAVILIVKYTDQNKLTLYQGVLTSVAFFGYACNSWGSPLLSKYFGTSGACFGGVFICFLSQIATLILFILDKTQTNLKNESQTIKKQDSLFNFEKMWFKLRSLQQIFWINALLMLLVYGVQKSWYYYLPLIIIDKWLTPKNTILNEHQIHNKQIIAGNYITIEFLIAIFLVPLISYFIDEKGKRITLFYICVVLTIISTGLFIIIPPLFPSIIGGVAISIFFAVKRPTLAYLADKPELGLAYGIQLATQNFSVLLLPICLAKLANDWILLTLLILSCASVIVLIFLTKIDQKRSVSLETNDATKLLQCLVDEKAAFKAKNKQTKKPQKVAQIEFIEEKQS